MPVGLAVEGANRNDMKLVAQTLESIPVPRPEATATQPQGMCLDKGYDYDEVRDILKEFGFTGHICARGEEAKAIKKRPSTGESLSEWLADQDKMGRRG